MDPLIKCEAVKSKMESKVRIKEQSLKNKIAL